MMKHIYRHILTGVVILLSAHGAYAQQNMRTAYFMDSYTYRYRFNPAFGTASGHFGLFIGNTAVTAESNMGLSTFLYPNTGGKLSTCLNSDVSSEEFLGKLSDKNMLHAGLDMNLLSIAFNTGNASHFIDLGIRSNTYSNLPYDLFRFAKEGAVNGSTFNFDNVGIKSCNYAELSYGFALRILDNVSIGARIKLLGGLGEASLQLKKASLIATDSQWRVSADGELVTCLPEYVKIPTDASGAIDFDNMEVTNTSQLEKGFPAGVGAAVDLGVTADINENLQLSFAVLDAGKIKWKHSMTSRTNNVPWNYTGFNDIVIARRDINDPDDGSMSSQLDQLADDLKDCFTFYKDSEGELGSSLEMTVNAGIQYTMPFYDRLSAGLLMSGRIYGSYSWVETRICANISPLKCFHLAASGAYSKFGPSVGTALNFNIGALDFFAGLDSLLPFREMTPQYVPVGKLNTNATFGMNIIIK